MKPYFVFCFLYEHGQCLLKFIVMFCYCCLLKFRGFFPCSLDHYLVKVYMLNVVTVACNAVCCLSFCLVWNRDRFPKGFWFLQGSLHVKFELHCFYLAFFHLFIVFFWVSKSVFVYHAAGSINISNILTGKCLAKIRASSSLPIDKCCCSGCFSGRSCSSKKRIRASRLRSTVAEALEDITALFYDEERNEIYTGNRHGLVHVWSN